MADDDAWVGTTRASDPAAARLGDRAVSTCEMNANAAGCDAPTGTLTSPLFRVTNNWINGLLAGGNGGAPVGVRLVTIPGDVIHEFRPNSCGPSFIDGDNDWTRIDTTAINGTYVKLQIFDEEPGGCGFVSFDHFYQAGAGYNPSGDGADGGVVSVPAAAEANLGFDLSLADDGFDQVIGRFDDATVTASTWTMTGAFMNPANATAWANLTNPGRVGPRGINTCESNANAQGCDAPVGTLTSPGFTVDAARPFLNFAMAGGNGSAPVG